MLMKGFTIKSMRILSLDLSTVASGYAVFDGDKLLTYGVIHPADDLSESARYFHIAHQITGLIQIYNPDDLVIEDTFCGPNVVTLKQLNRLAGCVLFFWFSKKRREAYFYMAMSARKYFPELKGNSTKEEIVEAVNKFFKLRGKLTDHNIADAIVMGHHHCQIKNGNIVELDAPRPKQKRKRKKPDVI
jgi:Holliday junction resolvasome RuvABC endonuclease subunit